MLGETQNKKGYPIIWIIDNVSQECGFTIIVKLELLKDSVIDSLEHIPYKYWLTIGQRIGNTYVKDHGEFKKQDSSWIFDNKQRRIRIPQPDSLVLSEYKSLSLSTSEIPMWNKEHGMKAIMVPEIEGMETEFIYAYPRGVYINYDVDKVCYFYKQEYFYLLIFIKQPKKAAGLDSMHGFLLLKGKYK